MFTTRSSFLITRFVTTLALLGSFMGISPVQSAYADTVIAKDPSSRNAALDPALTTMTAASTYSSNPLYLSLSDNQTLGGVAFSDEDILRFDGQNWSMIFDGSDVGVSGRDLFAFSIMDSDTILMSFNSNITVNGLLITPRDVVRFDATSLGSVTAGTFSMYLNGIDVGLDSSSENIDALELLPDGRVLISTTGTPSVPPGAEVRDEDILVFTPTTLGNNTSGSWARFLDGSAVALGDSGDEDIDALGVSNGDLYLSTTGSFVIAPGLSGGDEDIFICMFPNVSSCSYPSVHFFDGSTWGLAVNDVDGFDFLTQGPVPTTSPVTPTSSSTPTQTPTPTPTATQTSTPSSRFIQILQPNGGESMVVASTYRITWNSSPDIDKVTIGYKSCESCLSWIATNIPNLGYYDWTVNVGNTTNTQFKIYITGYDTGVGSVVDQSDNFFTVWQPTTPTPTWTPAVTSAIYSETFQPNAAAGMDTYLMSTSANTNFGSEVAMGVGENNNATNRIARGLIRFDLSLIPSNATIVSAILSLSTASDLSDNNRILRVYRLRVPFDETQATWNIARAGLNWQVSGASGGNDRESVELGSIPILANEPVGIQKQITLDEAKVQEWVSGEFVNNGLIIMVDTELNDRFNYKSSDTSNAAQRPTLVIQYTLP